MHKEGLHAGIQRSREHIVHPDAGQDLRQRAFSEHPVRRNGPVAERRAAKRPRGQRLPEPVHPAGLRLPFRQHGPIRPVLPSPQARRRDRGAGVRAGNNLLQERRWTYPLVRRRSAGRAGISRGAAAQAAATGVPCRRRLFRRLDQADPQRRAGRAGIGYRRRPVLLFRRGESGRPSADVAQLRECGGGVRRREQNRNGQDAEEIHEADGPC